MPYDDIAVPEDLPVILEMVAGLQKAVPAWNGQPITPEESVTKMLKVFSNLTSKDNGAFMSTKGTKEWL